MDLFPFQIAASTEIANKFADYAENPLLVTFSKKVPFYQNLGAITGGGKTLILCDAVAQMRSHLPVEPIVLWLSKGRVVVWQTYTNLSTGKYSELVSGFNVKPLMDCKQTDIEKSSTGLVLVATVGKFNQKDKEEGDRKIYQLALDNAESSLWDMLKKRRDSKGRRRPFIIVYDEGHNLSNQQTELLLELEPDALIAASATMRIPDALTNSITRLKQEKGWKEENFATVVKSSDVVKSGLVKKQILLGGYVTPMEIAIDEMIDNLKRVEKTAKARGLPFAPKAIYVSQTNVVSGKGNVDNVHTSFEQRQARPILIWRHLVEVHKIKPEKIAVYCNLKFDPKFPPPPGFNLFAGGDADYDNFVAGNFQHIIFNLTLQEGWDDPACYFAYIDKEMGSKEQVTQIVGRVLRQPEAKHYPDPALNTAHFYIRTDEKKVFEEVLSEIKKKIAAETPEISLTVFTGKKGASNKTTLPVKKNQELPETSIDCKEAVEPIKKIIRGVQDFRKDEVNTVGKGGRIQILQVVGKAGKEQEEWVEVEHSNRVTARWVFVREVQKTYSSALNLCDIEEVKFDALIEYNSPAAEHMREAANKVVNAYIENSLVIQNFANPIEVPDIAVDPSNITKFSYALHAGYSDLNKLEKEFAEALDKQKKVWFRNPSRGLFEVPLLSKGGSKNFNPDFLVWADKAIIAIDTKGDHLIVEDAGRKLFHINKIGKGPDVIIRLITRGKWDEKIQKTDSTGFTVWSLKNGKPHPLHAANVNDAVKHCLKQG
jgi:type III restriction enzyme